MIVGVMQPYFVPYIGYWQLMNAVDKYVIYDDVNYINRGWINRNRILVDGKAKYFNVPMIGASQNKLINEIGVNADSKLHENNLRVLKDAYKKAPYFEAVYALMEKVITCGEDNLAAYLVKSFQYICEYLEIHTELILSSDLEKDNTLRGQDKILSICEILGATEYYNAIGGQELYSFERFREKGMQLKFLKTNEITYRQFGNDYLANLSIIDVMMFNSKEEVKRMLNEFVLVED